MPIKKICEKCGKEFNVPPSRASARFCSRMCSVSSMSHGSSNPNWKGGLVLGKCFVCDNETAVKISHAKKGAGRFCSRVCKGKFFAAKISEAAIKKRILKHCKICNKEIRVKPSHKDVEGTYCSKVCMAYGYKTLLSGKENPNYRHGKSHISNYYAKSRMLADGFYEKNYPDKLYLLQRGMCANCNKKLNGKYDVDHIYPIARGGTNWPHNIQLLCKSCNCKKHAKDPFEWANENGRLL